MLHLPLWHAILERCFPDSLSDSMGNEGFQNFCSCPQLGRCWSQLQQCDKVCACKSRSSLCLLTSNVAPSPARNTGSSIKFSVRGQTRLLAMLAWLPLVVAPKDPPAWLLVVAARLLAVAKDATELLLRA